MSFNARSGYSFHDMRELARRRLPHGLFEFVDRGAEDDAAVRNNHASFERLSLHQRPLVDVSSRDLSITLFGRRQTSPFCLAPTGAAGLLWYEGEVATARAAGHAGVPYTMSTGLITSMERVADAVPDTDLWFQLYLFPDTYLQIDEPKAMPTGQVKVYAKALEQGLKGEPKIAGLSSCCSETLRAYLTASKRPL